jgi:hypothetical protein
LRLQQQQQQQQQHYGLMMSRISNEEFSDELRLEDRMLQLGTGSNTTTTITT